MTKEEISHLSTLARIKLTDEEITSLTKETDAILAYVSSVDELVTEAALQKTVGRLHNVFREDEVTTPSGTYSEALTEAFPDRQGPHLAVKKILHTE
jgi:aspartyl-tRNA(Asn)/glutamyl-tRNA(Gln) amidotransferase subunit C